MMMIGLLIMMIGRRRRASPDFVRGLSFSLSRRTKEEDNEDEGGNSSLLPFFPQSYSMIERPSAVVFSHGGRLERIVNE
jgi:hypothetical protein